MICTPGWIFRSVLWGDCGIGTSFGLERCGAMAIRGISTQESHIVEPSGVMISDGAGARTELIMSGRSRSRLAAMW
jgi:hypothetical protein